MIRDELVLYVEAALLSAGRPVEVDELVAMFEGRDDAPDRSAVREAVAALAQRWHGRALEVAEVASGFRAQIRREFSQAISTLWQERPTRYSRALLETLALIAYRQPVSRGEIEEVRGVGVSSSIMKTLTEREWVRVVGHRETPGRPALYGTTKHFLDTFNLESLAALPPLAELRDLEDPPPDLFALISDVPAEEDDAGTPGMNGADEAVTAADANAPDPAAQSERAASAGAGSESSMDAPAQGGGAATDPAAQSERAASAGAGCESSMDAPAPGDGAAPDPAAQSERAASAGAGCESSMDAPAPVDGAAPDPAAQSERAASAGAGCESSMDAPAPGDGTATDPAAPSAAATPNSDAGAGDVDVERAG